MSKGVVYKTNLILRPAVSLFAFAALAGAQVVIDGVPGEPFWSRAAAARLAPVARGIPAGEGGEVRSAIAAGRLYVALRMPEPSGRITARSIGRNPNWEEEDLVRLRISGDLLSSDWVLQIGPWGATSVERKELPVRKDSFLMASRTGEREWTAEVAVPLHELGTPPASAVRLTVERVRAARPGRPEMRWRWPRDEPSARVASLDVELPPPVFRPPVIGNDDPPLEVRRGPIPPLEAGWSEAAWRDAASWLLRDESPARAARHSTRVKLLHDGATLALLARCEEPGAPVADDSVQVYLAASGSAFVQLSINPAGTLFDAAGKTGGQYISRPRADWDSGMRGLARAGDGFWLARLDIPLDTVAAVLGEEGIPRVWRLLVMRSRAARPDEPRESSVLPVIGSDTPLCPARYRRMSLVETHAKAEDEAPAPTGSLPPVLEGGQRRMLDNHIRERVRKVLEAERRDWERVTAVAEWERFRDPRIKALAASLGGFPPRSPLNTRVTKEYTGNGYRRQDLVYESRAGLWVTANLYLPAEPRRGMTGILIVHSHHRPRTQAELQDMGILWARAGAAVLVMDQVGSGERLQNYPWNREAYHSRYILGMQLHLAGESLIQWMVWDILRGEDLLLARPDIDPGKIVLLGAVAGGGDPSAVAAALDPRIAAVAPFNFGESTPESPRFLPDKNRWPHELADPGWGSWESTRNLRRSLADQFLPWLICASLAPRRFVYSFEMGWNVEELPAWRRYQKVFGLYQAAGHLAEAHGFGPFPGPGECTNIGPAQRRTLYPSLKRWFDLPIPPAEPDDRRPEAELAALTPALAAEIRMRPVHEMAGEIAAAKLAAARAQLSRLGPAERRDWLRTRWAAKLGDIAPDPRQIAARTAWTRQWHDATAGAVALTVEPGITVPMVLLRPPAAGRAPLVIAFGEGGKESFLRQREPEIRALLEAGIAVCLIDVRGTGETAPDSRRGPSSAGVSLASTELMLGNTLLGARLKDLRAAIGWAGQQSGLDAGRIALWGDSFAPPNPDRILFDELPQWQIGPGIKRQSEPLGGILALLGALYEPDVRAAITRGTLAGYLSVLDHPFAYLPADTIVPGILECGDLDDVAASLAPRAVLLDKVVDGRNRLVKPRAGAVDLVQWLRANL